MNLLKDEIKLYERLIKSKKFQTIALNISYGEVYFGRMAKFN